MNKKIRIILVVFTVLFVLWFAAVVKSEDPLTYGQVISKNSIPEHMENDIETIFKYGIPLNRYVEVFVPEQYAVIIKGYSLKNNLKTREIYLNSNQYHYTNVGDYVDIGKK